jgi:hypothetical protein
VSGARVWVGEAGGVYDAEVEERGNGIGADSGRERVSERVRKEC